MRFVLLMAIAFAMQSLTVAMAQEYVVIDFQKRAAGGFIVKSLKEMGSGEVSVAINGACIYYTGAACPQLANLIRSGAKKAHEFATHGGRESQNQYEGSWYVGEDYRICEIKLKKITLTPEATFTGTLQNNSKNLAFYAFVRGGSSGPDEIKATIYLKLVPAAQDAQCLRTSSVWECGEKTKAGQRDCIENQPNVLVRQ